jgi:hypothetical protein
MGGCMTLRWDCGCRCGECCRWHHLDVGVKQDGWCVNYSEKKGCKLPVRERPPECNVYLCYDVARNTPGYDFQQELEKAKKERLILR